MPDALHPVFERLRELLATHASGTFVGRDKTGHYGLDAPVGPATIKTWGGKKKAPTMPVAWVEVKKNYVSYHLMGIYMNPKLEAQLSEALRKRKQGKSCFNFTSIDEPLLTELDAVTGASLNALRKGGFIADTPRR